MKITFDKIITFIIFFTGIALLSVLVIFYYNTKKLKVTSDLVENAQEVITNSNNILLDILNIETGSRGYSLTGDVIFLQPFYIGSVKINSDIAILEISTKENLNQQLRISFLKQAVAKRLVLINNSIKSKKQDVEKNDSARSIAAETGKIVTDNIRSLLADINAEEFYLLKERKVENERINRNSELIFLLLVALILALVIAIVINQKARNKIAEKLKISTLVAEQATQKSEEAAKLKEAFLANMSHEIRTPMNAIIGFADIIYKGKLDRKEKEYIKIIKTAGESLLVIINDILDISKIESGMMTFEEHTFSVDEIFKSLHIMLMGKAKEKNLELLFTCDHDVPKILLGDTTRLTQIIINLVGNAIKFTHKGTIQVTAKVLKNETKITLLEFSVNDTGIGIPTDKLQNIFERFRQAESQTTRRYGGTGLGLSIAKQLVELQGGVLSVKSTLNVGSVFSFSISYKKSSQVSLIHENEVKKYNMEELSKLNILLVEDNPLNIKLILSLFSEYNLKVEVAEDGSIGIEKLKQNTFNIILMDMEMPIMNGYETTIIIRKEMNNNIPIIAMTAHAMAGEKERCLSLGMNDYISKPINANLLFEKIYNLTLNS